MDAGIKFSIKIVLEVNLVQVRKDFFEKSASKSAGLKTDKYQAMY